MFPYVVYKHIPIEAYLVVDVDFHILKFTGLIRRPARQDDFPLAFRPVPIHEFSFEQFSELFLIFSYFADDARELLADFAMIKRVNYFDSSCVEILK